MNKEEMLKEMNKNRRIEILVNEDIKKLRKKYHLGHYNIRKTKDGFLVSFEIDRKEVKGIVAVKRRV